jgi:putative nucleotidyltransferase with HDIG domain
MRRRAENVSEAVMSGDRPVTLVTSADRLARWDGRSHGWTVLLVAPGEPPQPLRSEGVVIVDLELADADHVQSLRGLLAHARGPRIFVVGARYRREEAQAVALGATDVVESPASVSLCADPRQALPRDGRRSAERGFEALRVGFAAVLDGGTLDPVVITEAGREIVASIGRGGVAVWLDRVRSHHSGTYRHCLMVTGLAVAFAKEIGLSEADSTTIAVGGLLHDLGKARIPTAILDKPGRLTAEEAFVMQSHAVHGSQFLKRQSGFTDEIRDMVRHHHEYLDGSGYPDRLTGARIPLLTRMLTIADVFAALVEERAYKAAMSSEEAYGIVVEMGRAGKLDTALVGRFRPVAVALRSQAGDARAG